MSDAAGIDGFYLARITTPRRPDFEHAAWHTERGESADHDHEAEGVVLAVFREGTIVGVDRGGCRYDGRYARDARGLVATVRFASLPHRTLIQGIDTGPDGLSFDLELRLDAAMLAGAPLAVETPAGPATIRLERLRGL